MPPPRPDLSLEQAFPGHVAGLDEAGRGPLAGPVVAACVILPTAAMWLAGLNDSKRLSAARREELYAWITTEAHHGIGLATATEIDTLNIHHASLLAMQRAFAAMAEAKEYSTSPQAVHALVDGKFAPALPCPATAVVQGDSRSLSIAAASIVAKVRRDRLMQALHVRYPAYGWGQNAGYPTAAHLQALRLHGVTPEHRRSFAPVRAALAEEDVRKITA